jgi:hypothetical protein
VLVSVAIGGLAGLLGSALWTWSRGAARAPSWFGFLKITYVRTFAWGVFTLTATAGINLSTSDHSHHEASYFAWYGTAAVAYVVIVVTTIVMERSSAGRSSQEEPGSRRAASPAERPEVGTIHEQHLHVWLADLFNSVCNRSVTGYAAFSTGADQRQRAIGAHFPDLVPGLAEWDGAVTRADAAPDAAREQVERAVIAANVPADYDRESIAEIIARFVTARPDYRIVLRAVGDGDSYWSVYTASGTGMELKIAELSDAHIDVIKGQVGAHEAALQAVVDSVRDSDRIPEIAASREALEALRQPLLELLGLKQAVSPILFAADCSYCQAQLQPCVPSLAA